MHVPRVSTCGIANHRGDEHYADQSRFIFNVAMAGLNIPDFVLVSQSVRYFPRHRGYPPCSSSH